MTTFNTSTTAVTFTSTATGATFSVAAIPAGGTAGQVLMKSTSTAFDVEWGTLDALPAQTGNAGKYLTTNGTVASWAAATGGGPTPATVTEWMRLLGNDTTDTCFLYQYAIGPDGITYACGYHGDGTPAYINGFVAAFDPDGAVLWANDYDDGTVQTRFYSIAVDDLGFLWVVGRLLTSPRSAVILKLRTDGTVVFANTYSQPTYNIESLMNIAAASDGSAVAAVEVQHSDGFDRIGLIALTPNGSTRSILEFDDVANGGSNSVYNIGLLSAPSPAVALLSVHGTGAEICNMLVELDAASASEVLKLGSAAAVEYVQVMPSGACYVITSPDATNLDTVTRYDATGVLEWSTTLAGLEWVDSAWEDFSGNTVAIGRTAATDREIAIIDSTGAMTSNYRISVGTGWTDPTFYATYSYGQDTTGSILVTGGASVKYRFIARLPIDGATHTVTLGGATVTIAPSTTITAAAATAPAAGTWAPAYTATTAITAGTWTPTVTDATGFATALGAFA